MAYYKARGFLQIVKLGGSIMRTLGKIAAMLGVIGAIVAGSATPGAAYYYHHHSGYQHIMGIIPTIIIITTIITDITDISAQLFSTTSL